MNVIDLDTPITAQPADGTICASAVLVYLHVRCYEGRALDRKVTREVAVAHNADERRAGRYNKCLIDPKAATFVAVRSAAGEMRQTHYKLTLPWAQDGARILPIAAFADYGARMRALAEAFNAAADAFVADYPRLKEQARRELNGLYSEDDYPSQDAMRRRFAVSISRYPVPNKNDFRVSLPEAAMRELRSEVERDVKGAAMVAIRDLWERLYAAVSHMVERLSNPDAIFRDSLVENVVEVCTLLPKLNFMGDPALDAMRDQVSRLISNLSAQRLREDKALRADVAAEAAVIQSRMAAFMGMQA